MSDPQPAISHTDIDLRNQTWASSMTRHLQDSISKTQRLRNVAQDLLKTTDALLLGVDDSKAEVDMTSFCPIQSLNLAQSSRQNFCDTIVSNFFLVRRRLLGLRADLAALRRNTDGDGVAEIDRSIALLDRELDCLDSEVTELERRLVRLALLGSGAQGSA